MDRQPPEVLLQFCKAMADESRLKVIGMVSAAERTVEELASMLNLKEPTVSHHLAVLKQLDLVKLRADGHLSPQPAIRVADCRQICYCASHRLVARGTPQVNLIRCTIRWIDFRILSF